MLELSLFNVVSVSVAALALYAAYGRLRKPPCDRRLSSHVPSVTRSLWAEVRFTWTMARKRPTGTTEDHGRPCRRGRMARGRAGSCLSTVDVICATYISRTAISRRPTGLSGKIADIVLFFLNFFFATTGS